jgi:hypothetical protein
MALNALLTNCRKLPRVSTPTQSYCTVYLKNHFSNILRRKDESPSRQCAVEYTCEKCGKDNERATTVIHSSTVEVYISNVVQSFPLSLCGAILFLEERLIITFRRPESLLKRDSSAFLVASCSWNNFSLFIIECKYSSHLS